MCDFEGHPKDFGGDDNPALHAGVAGQVVDHLNSSHSAVFPLLWEGSAHVELMLCFLTVSVSQCWLQGLVVKESSL